MAEEGSGLGGHFGHGDTVTSKHVNKILMGSISWTMLSFPYLIPDRYGKKRKKKNPLTAKLFLKAFLFGLKYFKSLDMSDLNVPGYSFIKEDYTS